MTIEVRVTRIAETQITGLRGPNRRAFERFRDELGDKGCEALHYRVTGEHVDKLCVRHLRGAWRVVVAFHPDENTAWIVLVAEHTDDDRNRNVYELLYEIVGHRPPSDQRRRKPPCWTRPGLRQMRPSNWLSCSRPVPATWSATGGGDSTRLATASGRSSVEVRSFRGRHTSFDLH